MGTRFVAFAAIAVASVGPYAIPSQASIIYTADFNIRSINITGTITTDGDLGDLTESDITSVALVMHTIYGDFNLDKVTTLVLTAPFGLVATPTELDWDYAYGLFVSQLLFSSKNGLQFIVFTNGPPLLTGNDATALPLDIKLVSQQKGDVTVLGVASSNTDPPATPEPATIATMLGGASLLGFLTRGRLSTR